VTYTHRTDILFNNFEDDNKEYAQNTDGLILIASSPCTSV